MKKKTRFVLALLIPMIFAFASSAVTRAEDPAGFSMSLFDGETLNGWQVRGCEAEVQDGTIFLKAGNGLVRTEHRYRDFILELDWLALRKEGRWDSGIYFRCELPEGDRPWPSRYQANLLRGQEGNVGGVKGATSKGLVKDGEWNRFKLSVIGTKASLEINDKPAWEGDGIASADGFIALQAEVPGGGQFKFRNIRITEVGYASLLDDKLSAWEGAGSDLSESWEIKNGVLGCLEKKGPWLRSKQQHGDINLRLEYKVKPGGNSGVYARVPESGNHHGENAGVEIQILDDAAEKHAKLKKFQYCGSVYAVAPSTKHVCREPGQWNTMEINAQGHAYRVTHNGEVIVDANVESFPELEKRLTEGFLGLQHHGGGVWFRNIRVGPAYQ